MTLSQRLLRKYIKCISKTHAHLMCAQYTPVQMFVYTCAHSLRLHDCRCLCILPLTRKITHLSATLNTELRSIFGAYNNQKITKI